ARWRRHVVAYGRAAPESGALRPAEAGPAPRESRAPYPRRNWTWAAIMRRAFALDVLACPRCGARLRVVAPHRGSGRGAPNPGVPRSARCHRDRWPGPPPLPFPPGPTDLISQRGTAIPRPPGKPGPESTPFPAPRTRRDVGVAKGGKV